MTNKVALIVRAVNFLKINAVRTRLFIKQFKDRDSTHKIAVLYIVWSLLKSNM